MKYIFMVASLLVISGCSLSLDDVRLREQACKAEGGKVIRVMTENSTVYTIRCNVDGVEYWVAPSGALK